MSPALPIVSGAAVVAALAKVGYVQVSQRGIVPLHRELASGTLRSILRQASLTPAEFSALL